MYTGIVKTSLKENERRLPIHPSHIKYLPESTRCSLVFEQFYGVDFKVSDREILALGCKTASREEILSSSDIVVLPKPVISDLTQVKEEAIICGWMHCVQNYEIAEIAIHKHLSYVSWECMHSWNEGTKGVHIFYRNNELAGYAAIIHVLQLMGIDGYYGDRRHIVILGYGSVSRGAIYALHGRGFNNITVISKRDYHLIADKNPDVYYKTYKFTSQGILVYDMEGEVDIMELLSSADMIVNGVIQDVNNPIVFVKDIDLPNLKNGCIIVDISCDKGMGFEFARPTTFDSPFFEIGDIIYYAVDHTPTYLWKAATRELSLAFAPFTGYLTLGLERIKENEILRKAIEIEKGVIINNNIINFQNRDSNYPYHSQANISQ